MTNEELIQKLRGLQRCEIDWIDGFVRYDTKGDYIEHEALEQLINELEKPELFCKTIKVPYNSTLSTSADKTVSFTLNNLKTKG